MANITYRVNSNPAIPGTSIVKGVPLTNVEVDANFRAIDIEVDQLNSSTVRLTGNQTIDGVKTFSQTIAGAIHQLRFSDNRNVAELPGQVPITAVTAEFKTNAAVGNPPVSAVAGHSHIINVAGWTDGSGGWPTQISVSGSGLAVRQGVTATTWGSWLEMLHRGNGVALSGDQTIAGVKTFSSQIVGATNSQVSLTGDQTIAGVKTFSGQVNGKTSGTDSIPAFYAETTGGTFATMWARHAAPFHTVASTVGSSYAPALSHRYTHNGGWGGVYSVGVLNHAVASAGSFVIHHLNSGGFQDLAWLFNGANGEFISPGSITAPSITVGALPTFQCRAWANFNGTGTVAIRASGNVSSITDNGVGDYTVNFTMAMPDANSSVVVSGPNGWNGANITTLSLASVLAGSFRIVQQPTAGAAGHTDSSLCCVAVFR